MAWVYASGDKANILERLAASQITMTNEDANYPVAGLYDRVPSLEARFASAGADRAVRIDGDLLQTKGDMEGAGSLPDGWTNRSTGTGTAARSTANPHAGTAHLRLAGGASGVGAASRDVTYLAGERLIIYSFWVDADNTNYAELFIQNLKTGKFANPAGAWQTTPTYAVRGNSLNYANAAGGYEMNVEDFLACQADQVQLRITIRVTADVTIDVDDVALGVAANALTIHGHNVPPEITCEWRHSDDGVLGTAALLASATPYQPSFAFLPVLTGARSDKRYQHFKIPGTPTDGAISLIGELGLWCAKVAARSVELEPALEFDTKVIRNDVGGHVRVHRTNGSALTAQRVYRFSKRVVSSAEYQAIRDDLLRAHGGAHPILLIPDSTAPAPMPVIYGVVPAVSEWRQPLPTTIGVWDLDEIEIHEQPFPRTVL